MYWNLSEEEESKLVNGWFYNFKTDPKEYIKTKTKGFNVRLCQICNKVWQNTYNNQNIEYHDSFPRYGVPKKVCIKCEGIHE